MFLKKQKSKKLMKLKQTDQYNYFKKRTEV